MNTPFKGDSQLQAGLLSQMSEEYEEVIHRQHPKMEQEYSEEENESRSKPEYTEEELEKLRAAMKRTKCQILDCVLNILPPCLRAEAARICDLTKENDRIWINDKKEVILDGRVVPKSNLCTLIIEELMKCQSPVNTKQDETENKLLKYLLAHQTKALERERGVSICKKLKSMFDGCVEHFDDSDTDSDTDYDEEEDSEDEENEEDCHDEEDDTDGTEEYDDEDDEEYEEDDEEDDEDMEEYEYYSDDDEPSRKRKKN